MPKPLPRSTQRQRYMEGQRLGSLPWNKVAFFGLREDETPKIAASRIRSLLNAWKPTMYFKWSVSPAKEGVTVRKIGVWPRSLYELIQEKEQSRSNVRSNGMSKAYPTLARKYDRYLATPQPLEINQELYVGTRKVIIKEKVTRKVWEAERKNPVDAPPDGWTLIGDKPQKNGVENAPAAPLKYFYGADYV
jgi:hypothetical protein